MTGPTVSPDKPLNLRYLVSPDVSTVIDCPPNNAPQGSIVKPPLVLSEPGREQRLEGPQHAPLPQEHTVSGKSCRRSRWAGRTRGQNAENPHVPRETQGLGPELERVAVPVVPVRPVIGRA